jgi:hypothetical protein
VKSLFLRRIDRLLQFSIQIVGNAPRFRSKRIRIGTWDFGMRDFGFRNVWIRIGIREKGIFKELRMQMFGFWQKTSMFAPLFVKKAFIPNSN